MVSFCPHGGATSHTPENDGVSSQEIRRQSGVQLSTYRGGWRGERLGEISEKDLRMSRRAQKKRKAQRERNREKEIWENT